MDIKGIESCLARLRALQASRRLNKRERGQLRMAVQELEQVAAQMAHAGNAETASLVLAAVSRIALWLLLDK